MTTVLGKETMINVIGKYSRAFCVRAIAHLNTPVATAMLCLRVVSEVHSTPSFIETVSSNPASLEKVRDVKYLLSGSAYSYSSSAMLLVAPAI
jgi:hypothetical protein